MRRYRILLAEDDPEQRELYTHVLSDRGYLVCAVTNGREAEEAFESGTPDVVVFDVNMPEQGGYETLEHVCDGKRKIRSVLISAYSDPEDDGRSWLADAYLMKSQCYRQLGPTVDRLLR